MKSLTEALEYPPMKPQGPNSHIEPMPGSWDTWHDLLAIAPELKQLHGDYLNQIGPPRQLSDLLFLGLCAAFSHPDRRRILRTLILDLIAQDLLDTFLQPDTEGPK